VTAGGPGEQLDRRLYRRLNGSWGPAAERFFRGVTELGSIWAPVGATAALARAGRRREALDALGAAGAMWILGQILKRVVVRPRPYHALQEFRLLIHEPRGTSWPSSHPAVLLAFVTVASRNLDAGPAVKAGLRLLAGTVGLSRVHLGVHYPADVAGGLLLGRVVADLWSAVASPRVLRPSPRQRSRLQ
jgi:membrane-associated phospholipid phosphatase